jgi:hypothetical protein
MWWDSIIIVKRDGEVAVRFSTSHDHPDREFNIPNPRGLILLEFVARTCLEDWQDFQLKSGIKAAAF